ncbi:hypothetical protein Tco_0353640 [Tanacetum coccineum]
MLGIPMGSRKLEDLEQRPYNDPFIKEWEKQFKQVTKPTPAAIASVISDITEADFLFRMNFITLFGSTMGTLDNEEQDGMNVYKGLDVYVPPINDKEPETKKQYGELFNDNEFNLYESSKDEDSEGEPNGDNENNNHDDDGAPMADANNQKESDNQKKEQNKEEIDKQPEESGREGTEESGIQMDVGNQNEERNKEKDANETEDNDKMNKVETDDNKDENAEKEKIETEKEKQDKADKVDNVQEKQGDHKDEIGEDEF